jgi:Arc/MetJ family transcription regulator
MVTHMKTTIEIADPLLAQARAIAEREGTTLRALVESGLRDVVARRAQAPRFTLPDCSVGGTGISPEFATGGWPAVRSAIYGDGT